MEAKKTTNCKRCNKEFKSRINKKFCSMECRTRFNAYARWNLMKNNPKEKLAQKIRFDKWRKENREHFNSLLREPNRIRRLRLYKLYSEKGLCTECGKARDNETKRCSKCRTKQINYRRKFEAKKNKQILNGDDKLSNKQEM